MGSRSRGWLWLALLIGPAAAISKNFVNSSMPDMQPTFVVNFDMSTVICQHSSDPTDLHLHEMSILCDGNSDCYTNPSMHDESFPYCDRKCNSTCSNRGACLYDGEKPQCYCNSGFSGPMCEVVDTNECLERPCHLMAHCLNRPGGFTCECFPGFTGDGYHCADIDECSLPQTTCPENSVCVNLPGTHYCNCTQGYTQKGNSLEANCVDVDECALGIHNCESHQMCENSIGNFTCVTRCSDGFEYFNGECIDIDECKRHHVCDARATCTNTPGSYKCTCDPGMTGDGKECLPLKDCSQDENICDRHAQCIPALKMCYCQAGYAGDGIKCHDVNECEANENPCANQKGKRCVNVDGGYICCKEEEDDERCIKDQGAFCAGGCGLNAFCMNATCECLPGYSGEPNKRCLDLNECDSDKMCPGVGQWCINVLGSYLCCGPNSKEPECQGAHIFKTVDGQNIILDTNTSASSSGSVLFSKEEGSSGSSSSGNIVVGPVSLRARGSLPSISINTKRACTSYCPANSECINGFCECSKGYGGNPHFGCEDINECLTSSPCQEDADHWCVNTDGGFQCCDRNSSQSDCIGLEITRTGMHLTGGSHDENVVFEAASANESTVAEVISNQAHQSQNQSEGGTIILVNTKAKTPTTITLPGEKGLEISGNGTFFRSTSSSAIDSTTLSPEATSLPGIVSTLGGHSSETTSIPVSEISVHSEVEGSGIESSTSSGNLNVHITTVSEGPEMGLEIVPDHKAGIISPKNGNKTDGTHRQGSIEEGRIGSGESEENGLAGEIITHSSGSTNTSDGGIAILKPKQPKESSQEMGLEISGATTKGVESGEVGLEISWTKVPERTTGAPDESQTTTSIPVKGSAGTTVEQEISSTSASSTTETSPSSSILESTTTANEESKSSETVAPTKSVEAATEFATTTVPSTSASETPEGSTISTLSTESSSTTEATVTKADKSTTSEESSATSAATPTTESEQSTTAPQSTTETSTQPQQRSEGTTSATTDVSSSSPEITTDNENSESNGKDEKPVTSTVSSTTEASTTEAATSKSPEPPTETTAEAEKGKSEEPTSTPESSTSEKSSSTEVSSTPRPNIVTDNESSESTGIDGQPPSSSTISTTSALPQNVTEIENSKHDNIDGEKPTSTTPAGAVENGGDSKNKDKSKPTKKPEVVIESETPQSVTADGKAPKTTSKPKTEIDNEDSETVGVDEKGHGKTKATSTTKPEENEVSTVEPESASVTPSKPDHEKPPKTDTDGGDTGKDRPETSGGEPETIGKTDEKGSHNRTTIITSSAEEKGTPREPETSSETIEGESGKHYTTPEVGLEIVGSTVSTTTEIGLEIVPDSKATTAEQGLEIVGSTTTTASSTSRELGSTTSETTIPTAPDTTTDSLASVGLEIVGQTTSTAATSSRPTDAIEKESSTVSSTTAVTSATWTSTASSSTSGPETSPTTETTTPLVQSTDEPSNSQKPELSTATTARPISSTQSGLVSESVAEFPDEPDESNATTTIATSAVSTQSTPSVTTVIVESTTTTESSSVTSTTAEVTSTIKTPDVSSSLAPEITEATTSTSGTKEDTTVSTTVETTSKSISSTATSTTPESTTANSNTTVTPESTSSTILPSEGKTTESSTPQATTTTTAGEKDIGSSTQPGPSSPSSVTSSSSVTTPKSVANTESTTPDLTTTGEKDIGSSTESASAITSPVTSSSATTPVSVAKTEATTPAVTTTEEKDNGSSAQPEPTSPSSFTSSSSATTPVSVAKTEATTPSVTTTGEKDNGSSIQPASASTSPIITSPSTTSNPASKTGTTTPSSTTTKEVVEETTQPDLVLTVGSTTSEPHLPTEAGKIEEKTTTGIDSDMTNPPAGSTKQSRQDVTESPATENPNNASEGTTKDSFVLPTDATPEPSTLAPGNTSRCTSGDECGDDAQCERRTGACRCYPGFRGYPPQTRCSDVDECAEGLHNCHESARCHNFVGGYACFCPMGFRKNDKGECEDIDECVEARGACCSTNGTCVNNPGSYTCTCKPGFTGDGYKCMPMEKRLCTEEEWDKAKCAHNSVCMADGEGKLDCDTCKMGYEKRDNGTCVDLNECAKSTSNMCHEHANCNNFPGTYGCECKPGFKGDGFMCTDEDECLRQPCHPHAECTNTIGSFNCKCPDGFTGDGVKSCMNPNEKSCEDVQKFCGRTDNTACLSVRLYNGSLSSICECEPNFRFNKETNKCEDIDECAENRHNCDPASTICVNEVGGFRCDCADGYEGMGGICVDIDECERGIAGCHSMAMCLNQAGSCGCKCMHGYTGDGIQCRSMEVKIDNSCTVEWQRLCLLENKTCHVDEEDVPQCGSCIEGHHPINGSCQPLQGSGNCADPAKNNCDPNAECIDVHPGRHFCTCKVGYIGDGMRCDGPNCHLDTKLCHENGVCTMDGSCKCKQGFQGDGIKICNPNNSTQARLPELESTTLGTASPPSASPPNIDSIPESTTAFSEVYAETTTAGATSEPNDGVEVNTGPAPPAPNRQGGCTADNRSACHSLAICEVATSTCRCKDGYEGNGRTECRPISGVDCVSNSSICHGSAYCDRHTRRCVCPAGYIGDGILCSPDPQDCVLHGNLCGPEAICSGRRCRCLEGFTGDGIKCVSIHQRSFNCSECDANAHCTHGMCECNPGYFGNGLCCVPDPRNCGHFPGICHPEATCNPETSTCNCNSGFHGDGISCFPKVSCITDSTVCHQNAICLPSGECMCEHGYKGNGHHCVASTSFRSRQQLHDVPSACSPSCNSETELCFEGRCQCKDGFRNVNGVCQDIDECQNANPCHHLATCMNLPGTYSCKCPEGYVGDGSVCVIHKKIGQLDVHCEADGMILVLANDTDMFEGRMYVRGQAEHPHCSKTFSPLQQHPKPYTFKVPFEHCNVRLEDHDTFAATVIVQRHPMFVTKTADAYELKCTYPTRTHEVHSHVNVSELATSSILSDKASGPACRLTVTNDDHDTINLATVGQSLRLRLEVTPNATYGILPRNCFAVNIVTGERYSVTDRRGCAVDNDLVPEWRSVTPWMSEVVFRTFKWPDSQEIRFQCECNPCVGECEKVDCNKRPAGLRFRFRRAHNETEFTGNDIEEEEEEEEEQSTPVQLAISPVVFIHEDPEEADAQREVDHYVHEVSSEALPTLSTVESVCIRSAIAVASIAVSVICLLVLFGICRRQRQAPPKDVSSLNSEPISIISN